jgi:hypothetical protein
MQQPDPLSALIASLAEVFRDCDCPAGKELASRIDAATVVDTGPWPNPGFSAFEELLALTRSDDDRLPATDRVPASLEALPWVRGSKPMPPAFADCYLFNVLIGDGSPAPQPELLAGLYLQAPGSFYPSHLHAAEEIYVVLSGTAEWQQGSDDFRPWPPGSVIRHASREPHAMRTGDAPLLALWAWIGDLDTDSYRLL